LTDAYLGRIRPFAAVKPWPWVEHLHEERSSLTLLTGQGPKDNPRVPDNFARYGLLGERWTQPILNGMFTPSSHYSGKKREEKKGRKGSEEKGTFYFVGLRNVDKPECPLFSPRMTGLPNGASTIW